MIDDELVPITVAGQVTGISERSIRRYVKAGQVPVVHGPHGRLVRPSDVLAVADDKRTGAGHVPVPAGAGVPDTCHPSDSPDRQAPVMLSELLDRLERQAEEIGALRERIRALEATQSAPASPPVQEPAAPPVARPVPSWGQRLRRWWLHS